MNRQIRRYQPGEECELWNLFFNTIRTVNVRDYTWEQVCAWAPDEMDETRWRTRIAGINPLVCVHEGAIVGYAGLLASGYLDHFFVHHQWQGQGVGRELYAAIEAEARRQGLAELTTDASITAKPFFESRGFRVVTPQDVALGAVILRNFKMRKTL